MHVQLARYIWTLVPAVALANTPDVPPESLERTNSQGILIWVETPRVQMVGDTFVVSIRLENWTADPFKVEDIDFGAQYIGGFQLVDALPRPSELDWSGGDLSMTYDRIVEPSKSFEMKLHLRAKRAGIYLGDVDVWFGLAQSYSRIAQTRVLPQ
jgi:hypothetical protein